MFSRQLLLTESLSQCAAFQTWKKSSPHSALLLFEVVPTTPKYVQFLLIMSVLDDKKRFDHQIILESILGGYRFDLSGILTI